MTQKKRGYCGCCKRATPTTLLLCDECWNHKTKTAGGCVK